MGVVKLAFKYSLPLILGVVSALVWVNFDEESYLRIVNYNLLERSHWNDFSIFGYDLSLHFLVNDIFMVFFFGIVSVEIVSAFSKGGSLNPISRAINPLFGTFGGIIFPIAFFLLFCKIFDLDLFFSSQKDALGNQLIAESVRHGWGITMATDIALAWLFARYIFGSSHKAIPFLLLLAIGDDAIGLIVLAVFYTDPDKPVEPIYLLLVIVAMFYSYLLRQKRVRVLYPYILGACLAWIGLQMAHVHPSLALVFIVPFMTNPDVVHFHKEEKELSSRISSAIDDFEHRYKYPVEAGLFFFGLVNAGVKFGSINILTYVIFFSLFLGKPLGIFLMSFIADKLGYGLGGIRYRELFIIGLVAGIGLTVALFMAQVAYISPLLREPAKMGAILSVFAGFLAYVLSRLLGIKKEQEERK